MTPEVLDQLKIIANVISAVIVAIVGPAIIIMLKNILDSSKTFNKALSETVKIDFLLSSILNTTKADRIFLLNYHNGGMFYSGKPRQKISMSFERCESDVDSIIGEFQDIPISYFSQISYQLSKKGKVSTADVREMPESAYKDLMLHDNTVSQVSIAIYKDYLKLTWKSITALEFKERRMIASLHLWFKNERKPLNVIDSIEFDKEISELRSLLI